jgi:DNA topoisomerase-6 subunit B
MVEAAVSLGGRDVKPGLNIFRFANRIPLLFEPGSDVVSKQAQEVDWGRYKIEKGTARVGVFVSVVSTRVPFRGTGKEHIAEDVKELAEEARRIGQRAWLAMLTRAAGAACADQESAAAVRAPAVQEARQAPGALPTQAQLGFARTDACRLQLAKQRKARKKALTRYIPDVARAVFAVLAKARPSRSAHGFEPPAFLTLVRSLLRSRSATTRPPSGGGCWTLAAVPSRAATSSLRLRRRSSQKRRCAPSSRRTSKRPTKTQVRYHSHS